MGVRNGMDGRVLACIEENPGCRRAEIAKALGDLELKQIANSLHRLRKARLIDFGGRRSNKGRKLYVSGTVPGPEIVPDGEHRQEYAMPTCLLEQHWPIA